MTFEFVPRAPISIFFNTLIMPEKLGKGNVRKIDIGTDFKLLFHHYTFKEDFMLRRKAPEVKNDMVILIFYTTALPENYFSNEKKSLPVLN